MNKIISKTSAGVSVTQRIKAVKQPRGGYVRPRDLEKIQLDGGGIEELPDENVHAALVGIAVDYLTRFVTGTSVREAFKISHMGASVLGASHVATCERLMEEVKGLDDASIRAAVKLSGFDSAFRAGAIAYRSVEDIEPDADCISHIRIMVERSVSFFEQYGPKVLDGLTFEGGYTDVVSTGDGDFMTADTLWDFKVSKTAPKTAHTLQLLMYWRMGLHSTHPEYSSVKYLGLYNPRMNIVYRYDVANLSQDVIDAVEKEVIGY